MPFVYDNLIASVIGATVFLILISIQMRSTNANVAQTSRTVALKQAQTLATWLEEDLGQMGRNMDSTPFMPPERTDEEASPTGETGETFDPEKDSAFEFEYKDENGNTTTVQYSVRESPESPVDVDGGPRTLYELERNGSGGSAATLGYFDIRFLNDNAGVTTDPDAIQSIRVHFSVVAPFRNDETTLHEVHRMIVVPYAPAQD